MTNKSSLESFEMQTVAVVHSPYKQKFAIPRQPGLVTAAEGKVELLLDCDQTQLIKDISLHSHLWLIFVFHGTKDQGWKPMVKAPRLGGNKKTGVLATRSTFRPNPIGMSVVKLDGISKINGRIAIDISGLDLLDGTPILDIKPYIPYSDNITTATSKMAESVEYSSLNIEFSTIASQQLIQLQQTYPKLQLLIEQVLAQDPRPAYKKQDLSLQEFGMSLYDLNIRWHTQNNICTVIDISAI